MPSTYMSLYIYVQAHLKVTSDSSAPAVEALEEALKIAESMYVTLVSFWKYTHSPYIY